MSTASDKDSEKAKKMPQRQGIPFQIPCCRGINPLCRPSVVRPLVEPPRQVLRADHVHEGRGIRLYQGIDLATDAVVGLLEPAAVDISFHQILQVCMVLGA